MLRHKHMLWAVFVVGSVVFLGGAAWAVATPSPSLANAILIWIGGGTMSLAFTALLVMSLASGCRVFIDEQNKPLPLARAAITGIGAGVRSIRPDRGRRVLGAPAPLMICFGGMCYFIACILLFLMQYRVPVN